MSVVEFQPSAWSKGSYLNVAAHWLWSEIGSLSFDFGGRIAEHVEYVSDDQFTCAAADLVAGAAVEAQRLAGLFESVSDAANVLMEAARTDGGEPHIHPGWTAYNAGVAAALVGRVNEASKLFTAIVNSPPPPSSLLHPVAERMQQLLGDPSGFREEVMSLIKRQREKLGLPSLTNSPF